MLWTKTGPYARQDLWNTQPMQSANPHDPGWGDMMRHGDRMALIVPPNLRNAVASPNFNARDNIATGVWLSALPRGGVRPEDGDRQKGRQDRHRRTWGQPLCHRPARGHHRAGAAGPESSHAAVSAQNWNEVDLFSGQDRHRHHRVTIDRPAKHLPAL